MTPLEITLRVAAGGFLILINAYFVAIEFALTRVRQYPKSEFDTPALPAGVGNDERSRTVPDDLSDLNLRNEHRIRDHRRARLSCALRTTVRKHGSRFGRSRLAARLFPHQYSAPHPR